MNLEVQGLPLVRLRVGQLLDGVWRCMRSKRWNRNGFPISK